MAARGDSGLTVCPHGRCQEGKYQDGSATSEVQSSDGSADAENLVRGMEVAFTWSILWEMRPGGQLNNFVKRQR